MVFKYAIHDGTNAALHSGLQGSKQPTAATIRRAEARTTKTTLTRLCCAAWSA